MPPSGALRAPSETQLPAQIGPYRVVSLLATGTTSDVLLAREEGPHGFERLVALKVLLPRFRGDKDYARLFAREASAYARLLHPAVARFYQLLEDNGELALVLEYVEGLPLHKLRAELQRLGARLSDEVSIFIGFRLFSALSAAHGARNPVSGEFSPVIHGDVTSSNLIVPWDGYVKLIDFGSAKVSGVGGDVPDSLAMHSQLSPDPAHGREVTVRTDLRSACLILWELLTGHRATGLPGESSGEVPGEPLFSNLPLLETLRPELPRAIHDIVARGLRPDPKRRDLFAEEACHVLRSAADLGRARSALAEALEGLRFASIEDTRPETIPSLPSYELADEPLPPLAPSLSYSTSPPFGLMDPLLRPRHRSRWTYGLAGLFVLALVCAGSLFFLRYSRRGEHAVASASAVVATPSASPRPASALMSAAPHAPPISPVAPPTGLLASAPAPDFGPKAPSVAARLPSATAPSASALPASAPSPRVSPAGDGTSMRSTLTVPSRAGHRVWVDGRIVGESPGTFAVPCGPHTVRVGSHSPVQRVDTPCGGDLIVR